MQNITPFLWFDNNAEEAINFTCLFLRIQGRNLTRYGDWDLAQER